MLAFPGIFRGALDVRARDINDEMKVAAAYAIAGLVDEKDRSADYIIPNPFDKRVAKEVAKAVAEAARKSGVARIYLIKQIPCLIAQSNQQRKKTAVPKTAVLFLCCAYQYNFPFKKGRPAQKPAPDRASGNPRKYCGA